MVDKGTASPLETSQVATTELAGPQTTPNVPSPQTTSNAPPVNPLYSPQGPQPRGENSAVGQEMAQEEAIKGENAPGVEGEEVVWESRYSMKNFLGRITLRALLTVAWIVLAIYTWGEGHTNLTFLTVLSGIVLGALWVGLGYRILKARYGHYYRLTTRRLFVSTGLMRRRRDQMELLRVKDVFTRQTLIERWLSLGTVVVVSTEAELPTFYLAGVNDPKRVMDLVWHCARSEREGKTVQVERF